MASRYQLARRLLHIRDEKTQNTAGGTFTSGAWQTRDLNTIKTNEIPGASLSANQITLLAGTYEIDGSAPANAVTRHQARLYDTTGAAVLVEGTVEYSAASTVPTRSFVRGRFTLGVTSVIRLEHRCATTVASNGYGVEANLGTEVYSEVMIRRIA